MVLVCDHASNRIPLQLKDLGLPAQDLATHIAWDPGAIHVARYLSRLLDAPLVASNYSRLVIDCNRCPDHESSIPGSSAGIPVPGNLGLSAREIMERRQTLFYPYHEVISRLLRSRTNRETFILSIHSFTPFLAGQERPWPVGVCYETGNAPGSSWVRLLSQVSGVPAGDNQPYSIEAGIDYTLPTIVGEFGVPAIMLELRQDEIANPLGVEFWGGIIGKAWHQYAGDAKQARC